MMKKTNPEDVMREIDSFYDQNNKSDDNHILSAHSSAWKYWKNCKDGSVKLIPACGIMRSKMPYYMESKLILMGGYTSAGKSTLMAQMAVEILQDTESSVDIISLEDSRDEKYMAMVSILSGIGKKSLITGAFHSAGYEDRVFKASSIVCSWNAHIYDNAYSLSDIENIIKRSESDIIFIDYVQNIYVEGNSEYVQMSTVAKELFRMKKQYKKCIIALSQVSNESVKNQSEVISLKGSGGFAAAADIVMIIKKGRSEENKRIVEIDFAKNRTFGDTGKIDCQYSRDWTKIEYREGV